jgi:hypothetical protein
LAAGNSAKAEQAQPHPTSKGVARFGTADGQFKTQEDITFELRTDLTVSMEEFDNIRFLENPDNVVLIKTSKEFKSLVAKLDGKNLRGDDQDDVADEISLAIQTMLQGSFGDLKIEPQASRVKNGPNYNSISFAKGGFPVSVSFGYWVSSAH